MTGLPEPFSDRGEPTNEIVDLAPGVVFIHCGYGGVKAAWA